MKEKFSICEELLRIFCAKELNVPLSDEKSQKIFPISQNEYIIYLLILLFILNKVGGESVRII